MLLPVFFRRFDVVREGNLVANVLDAPTRKIGELLRFAFLPFAYLGLILADITGRLALPRTRNNVAPLIVLPVACFLK